MSAAINNPKAVADLLRAAAAGAYAIFDRAEPVHIGENLRKRMDHMRYTYRM